MSEIDDRADGEAEGKRGRRDRARPPGPARRVRPELVGDAAAEQDDHEARLGERGQAEGRDREHGEECVGDERSAEADDGAGNERADRGTEPIEDLVEARRERRLDVERREAEHEQETGQHEAESGGEAAEPAGAVATEEHAELVRLGTGQDLVDGQRLAEGLLRDPALLVDELALELGDLCRRAAPGEGAEMEEAPENRQR